MNTNLLSEYWEQYKLNFNTDNFKKTESYKWLLFKQMYSIWKWEKDNSNLEMYKNTFQVDGPKNLWLSGNFFPIGMLTWMLEKFPDETGYAMDSLFDETQNISERIDSFVKVLDNKLPELAKLITEKPINHHYHGDLRAISIYLTLQFPEKYFLYKHNMFKNFSKSLQLPDVKSGKTANYLVYLEVCNELREFIKDDKIFVTNYKNYLKLNINYEDPYFHLLVQDFILFVSKKEEAFWIFQGNPKFYDTIGALQNEVLTTWKVAAHKDKIKFGDKVILWQSGDNAGCYALAKVTSEVGKIEMNPDEIQFYKTEYDENEDRVSIEIEHNLADEPILWEEIKELPELAELKVGNQGTNFTATEKEYNTIKNMISSDYDNFEKVLQKFNHDELKKYFTQLFEILDTSNLEKGDSRMLFSYNNRKLSFSVGQRIALIIRRKSARGKFLILTKGKLNENSSPFGATPPVLYTSNIDNLDLNYNEKQSVFEGVAYELNRVKSSGYRSRNYNDFENAVFDPLFRARFQQQKNKMMKNNPNLNQILFGPPGTGKTFNTINEALKIVDPIYYAANQKDRKKLTDRFKELLIKNTDENKGQIAFCTFHQSFSYEDFVEGIKPKTSDTKSVYYDVESGIFKRICQLADSYNSTLKVKTEGKLSWSDEQFRKASFYKLSLGAFYNPNDKPIYEYCRDNSYIAIGFGQENDFTGLSESQIVEKCDELNLEVTAAQQMNYFIHYLKKGNYVIIGNGNKYVRAIGKVVGDYEYVAESTIQYNHFRKVDWLFVDENIPIEEIYERGLSQKTMYKIDETALKQDFFTNKGQKDFIDIPVKDEKNYVLIIDEINRGNVSSIFGELITLIEKDKRAGCDEELEVTLPYSKVPFKVPNNVYLIGTMNTADRSIEALDTALRRRFSFMEMPPKPELIKTEGLSGKLKGIVKVIVNGVENDIDLESLLIKINTRLEKLIDKDHKIGHSYLLKVNSEETLKSSFRNEIIPLLEEYFFGDYGKIGLVLGNTFVEIINHAFDFASFDEYDTDIQSDLKEKKVFRIAAETNWDFSKI